MGILCEAELSQSSPHLPLEGFHRDGGRAILVGGVIGLVVIGGVLILIIVISWLRGRCSKASSVF